MRNPFPHRRALASRTTQHLFRKFSQSLQRARATLSRPLFPLPAVLLLVLAVPAPGSSITEDDVLAPAKTSVSSPLLTRRRRPLR